MQIDISLSVYSDSDNTYNRPRVRFEASRSSGSDRITMTLQNPNRSVEFDKDELMEVVEILSGRLAKERD